MFVFCANMSLTSFGPFLSCSHLLGLLVLMLHAEQLPLGLGAKYTEHPPCDGQHHLQEVCTGTYLVSFSLCTASDNTFLDFLRRYCDVSCSGLVKQVNEQ
jgi:hypothetical protein